MPEVLIMPAATRLTDYDMYRHLNNVAYLTLIEAARFEAFGQHMKVDLSRYTGITAKTEITYLKPAPFGLPLAITMSVDSLGDSSVGLHFDVVDASNHDKVFASCKIAQVTFDLQTMKPCAMPGEMRTALEKLRHVTEDEQETEAA
jgi:acyl-CoA thioester hydrolase